MAKKPQSFAEKAARGAKKEKQFKMVKYIKSVKSEKTGNYRFQESMLKIPPGMSLDAYLKQLEEQDQFPEEIEEPVEETKDSDSNEKMIEAIGKSDGDSASESSKVENGGDKTVAEAGTDTPSVSNVIETASSDIK